MQTYIGTDGILKVELLVGARDVDCDVVIVYTLHPAKLAWEEFINQTYGSDPIERPEQLPLEQRDPIE